MRIVFFGNERLASGVTLDTPPVLSRLVEQHEVVAVVCHQGVVTGRTARPVEVIEYAAVHHLPVLTPHNPRDIIDQLRELQADVAVLVAYGRIIPQDIIDIFPHGILNIHPSLLPAYRGSTPIEAAMLAGDATTGVSVMKLVAAMDAGPTYAQKVVTLTGSETKQQLVHDFGVLGAEMLLQVLTQLSDGTAVATSQDESRATYCPRLSKADGQLDAAKTAAQLEREIRAFAIWPKSRTALLGHDVIVTAAHVGSPDETAPLTLACANGTTLVIDQLIGPSGKLMTAVTYVRGYGKARA